jgi:hypothetical protein
MTTKNLNRTKTKYLKRKEKKPSTSFTLSTETATRINTVPTHPKLQPCLGCMGFIYFYIHICTLFGIANNFYFLSLSLCKKKE